MFNEVGRNDNFLAKAQKLSILPTSLYCKIGQGTRIDDIELE